MTDIDYDLLVLGSGPGGQKAAIAAAKLGRRAAVVERRTMVGGVCINTGTIPSKTLREAVALPHRPEPCASCTGRTTGSRTTSPSSDLLGRTQHVIGREIEVVRSQLLPQRRRPRSTGRRGSSTRTPSPSAASTTRERLVRAATIVIATGTRPAHPPSVDFDDLRILDSDGILHLEEIPRSLVVVGAGVIGIEYASMFAALGSQGHRRRVSATGCSTSATPRSSRR